MALPSPQDRWIDLLGNVIVAALFIIAAGALGGMYWLVFCHPKSSAPEWIPFLRPIRITLTSGIAFGCYHVLARQTKHFVPVNRRFQLTLILIAVTILSAIRYFYGTVDGSTVQSMELEPSVRWSLALGIFMPGSVFAILGYMVSRRSIPPDIAEFQERLSAPPKPKSQAS